MSIGEPRDRLSELLADLERRVDMVPGPDTDRWFAWMEHDPERYEEWFAL